MKKITLSIKKNEWLDKALKRKNEQLRDRNIQIEKCKNIPSNVILDKTLPGIGATHTEIKAKRNSIIIEPNVPVIIEKAKKHKNLNLLSVYDECTEAQIESYLLNNSIRVKKLITTPEGFGKIRRVVNKLYEANRFKNLYSEFFCLFDECEKITQDVDFRNRISNPVYDFFKFEGKAFVSATPLKIRHSEIKKQNFRLLKVEPDFDYSQEINVIVTNNFNAEFEERIKKFENSKCVCIFFSSTKGINRIINNTIKSDYKVFCSAKSARQLKNRGIKNVSSDFDVIEFAKYNFFTSRFYSALDINLKVRPDIIILTDIYEAEHTVIDPFTEAIQIQGRFRKTINGKRYNSITHITNIKKDLLARNEDDIMIELGEYKKRHEILINDLMEEGNVHKKRAIQKMIESSPYNKLLDDRNEINEFAIDNWLAEERVRRYYTSKEDLLKAYWETKFFVPNMITSIHGLAESKCYAVKKKKSGKAIIKEIISILIQLNDNGATESVRELLRDDGKFAEQSIKYMIDIDIIVDAYLALGSPVFEQVNYNFRKIKKKLETFKQEKKRKSKEVVLDIINEFPIGSRIDKNVVKSRIQNIYENYGIDYKVTHNTISEYFKVTPQNGDKPATYIFKSVLAEFSEFV